MTTPITQEQRDTLAELEENMHDLLLFGVYDDTLETSTFMMKYANLLNQIGKCINGTPREQIKFALAVKGNVEYRVKRELETAGGTKQ